jgi:tRNA threonylcarbamoyl adenosine modification protein YjeE
MKKKQQQINSIVSTMNLAQEIKTGIKSADTVTLSGNIGSGKSTFVKLLLKLYGFEYVGSPTFTTLHHYKNDTFEIVHLDLYNRKNKALDELIYYIDSIKLVEWPNQEVRDYFKPKIELTFSFSEGKDRYCEVKYL